MLFTPIVLLITALIIAGWGVALLRGIRGAVVLPAWVLSRQEALYLFFLNRGTLEFFVLHRLIEPLDRLLGRLRGFLPGRGEIR